jgi:hypothetical protein
VGVGGVDRLPLGLAKGFVVVGVAEALGEAEGFGLVIGALVVENAILMMAKPTAPITRAPVMRFTLERRAPFFFDLYATMPSIDN